MLIALAAKDDEVDDGLRWRRAMLFESFSISKSGWMKMRLMSLWAVDPMTTRSWK